MNDLKILIQNISWPSPVFRILWCLYLSPSGLTLVVSNAGNGYVVPQPGVSASRLAANEFLSRAGSAQERRKELLARR